MEDLSHIEERDIEKPRITPEYPYSGFRRIFIECGDLAQTQLSLETLWRKQS